MKKSKRLSETSTVVVNLKKLKARDKYLQKTYGISLLEYNLMLREQNNSCAICKKDWKMFKSSLAVDHNHKTNRTRGLLCFYCNHKLVGRHTIESASKILNYLLKYDVENGEGK